jgi:hypothetical protein
MPRLYDYHWFEWITKQIASNLSEYKMCILEKDNKNEENKLQDRKREREREGTH